jgi:hypothetical protein
MTRFLPDQRTLISFVFPNPDKPELKIEDLITNWVAVEAVKPLISRSGRTSNKLKPAMGPFKAILCTRSVVSSKVSPPRTGKEHTRCDGGIQCIGIDGDQIMICRRDLINTGLDSLPVHFTGTDKNASE